MAGKAKRRNRRNAHSVRNGGRDGRVGADAARRLEAHQRWLTQHEPRLTLSITPEAASAEVTGAIQVHIGAGIPRYFQVRLVYRKTRSGDLNPSRPPDTYEVGGRFPRGEPDRHIEPDGRWCMWHPLEEPRDFDQPDGMRLHLDRVRQFIVLQLTYEDRKARGLEPLWPGPEWDHGEDGHRQWAREHCKGIPAQSLRPLLLQAYDMSNDQTRVAPHTRCLCGSTRAWKNCHADWTTQLAAAIKNYPQPVVSEIVNMLKDTDDFS